MFRALLRLDTPAAVADWSAAGDAVMGGASRGRLQHDIAGQAVFTGEVSLANNGCFASVRSPTLDLGAPGATALLLEVRDDGKRYKLTRRTDNGFDGVNYQAAFDAPAGTARTADIWRRSNGTRK